MSRRDATDLWRAFGRGSDGNEDGMEAGFWEIYLMGVKDGESRSRRRRRRRASRLEPVTVKSGHAPETVSHALPYVRRFAHWRKISLDLLINGRDLVTARTRQEAYYVLRNLPGRPLSFPNIAEALGLKNHAAVIHGCNRVAARMATDPELKARLRQLTRRIGAAA